MTCWSLTVHDNLKGTIPSSIGKLTSMKYLKLMYNQLSGTIPSILTALTNLDYLALAFNRLTGTAHPSRPIELVECNAFVRSVLQMMAEVGTIHKSNHFSCPLPPNNNPLSATSGVVGAHCK
jgi:hypothetical protein